VGKNLKRLLAAGRDGKNESRNKLCKKNTPIKESIWY
jgi:hypothetical protein